MRGSLYTLPDSLSEIFRRDGVTIYEHVSGGIGSRYMLAFTRAALVVGLEGARRLSGPSDTAWAGPGSVVLHAPGRVVSVAVDDAGGPFRCLMIFAPISILSRLVAIHAGGGPLDPKAERLLGHFPRVGALAKAITEDLREYGPAPERINQTRLQEVLQLVALGGGAPALRSWAAKAADPPTLRIAGVMETHWQEGLTLTELAFLSGMSLAAFKRTFAKLYGMSPGQWLFERRMEQAAHLLGVAGERPSGVWQQVGFSSHSAFAQSFRRHFGTSPASYRAARFRASSHSNGADVDTP